ncbi:Os07g0663200 [Oryza sativa Japonica Group]|uniref:Os07g0663200 protein n=2 Tax=Oryza TaxID=4527 RepID=A0A0P0X9X9_ORYSJ|nr:hypothetical protein EE612_041203 [Oryza sativa]BAT03075.1 Os07g0663200 [Oryza sativa Japonica Group]
MAAPPRLAPSPAVARAGQQGRRRRHPRRREREREREAERRAPASPTTLRGARMRDRGGSAIDPSSSLACCWPALAG